MSNKKDIKINNKELKKKLIKYLKNYNKTCPECGKLFLGARLIGVSERSMNTIEISIEDYLSCGKCPECALKCYNNRKVIVGKLGQLPCLIETIQDYEDIDDYLNTMIYEIECASSLNENYNEKQISVSCPQVDTSKLIDLLELLESFIEI